jgi:hypothetical protein
MRKFAFAAVAVLGLVLSASSARAEDMDNPEYGYWSSFKAGSFVVMKMETETGGNKSDMEYTYTLKEITKEKAVVETKGHMMMGGNKIEIPANSRDIPAKVKKGEDTAKKDAPKAKEGDEEVEVGGGKKVKAHWTESETEASGMKTKSKSWMSKDIPGHLAKMESHSEGAMKSHTKMWAEKWEAK